MKKILIFTVLLLQSQFSTSICVENAYWYNLEPINISLGQYTIEQHSYLEIVSDTSLRGILYLEAIFSEKEEAYKKTFEINDSTKKSIINGNLYSYFLEVPYFKVPPIQIKIKDKYGFLLKNVECKYSKLEGYVKCDLQYNNLYVGVVPNGFQDPDLFQPVQVNGYYSMLLPQRYYNAAFAVADSYGKHTLESWTFNINGNTNLKLDYNIQNIEIYNLHTWENNGGGKDLFIVFRPMSLKQQIINKMNIGNEIFTEIDFQIDLKKENINISVEKEILKIISIQSFFETNSNGSAFKSYMVQTEFDKKFKNKLLTVKIDFNKNCGNSSIFLK